MPDFGLVPHALLSPCRCVACNGHADPHGFVDLVADLPGYGRIYLCAGCVGMAAGGLGWIEPRVAGEMTEGLRAAQAECRELALELARAEGTGEWTWTPTVGSYKPNHNKVIDANGAPVTVTLTDPTVCECGKPKRATSKSCRSCSAGRALDARKAGATA